MPRCTSLVLEVVGSPQKVVWHDDSGKIEVVSYICPFAEIFGKIANFQTAIYGVDIVDTPIFRGGRFFDAPSCQARTRNLVTIFGTAWRNLRKKWLLGQKFAKVVSISAKGQQHVFGRTRFSVAIAILRMYIQKNAVLSSDDKK